ncbi:MAG: hypothetical protein QOH50_2766, partial [Kribbellaceae bacterium]|nr:hypothetical protein [Kribbellaceae bacterium]
SDVPSPAGLGTPTTPWRAVRVPEPGGGTQRDPAGPGGPAGRTRQGYRLNLGGLHPWQGRFSSLNPAMFLPQPVWGLLPPPGGPYESPIPAAGPGGTRRDPVDPAGSGGRTRQGLLLEPGRGTPLARPVNLPEPSEVPFPSRFGDSYHPLEGRTSPQTRRRTPRARVRLIPAPFGGWIATSAYTSTVLGLSKRLLEGLRMRGRPGGGVSGDPAEGLRAQVRQSDGGLRWGSAASSVRPLQRQAE